jgi:hypothetical protein
MLSKTLGPEKETNFKINFTEIGCGYDGLLYIR